MKKFLMIACIACTIGLTSCCHRCEKFQCCQDTIVLNDTTVVETFDTVCVK